MKRILLLFSIFLTAATVEENLVNETASTIQMRSKDVQTCVNMTNLSRDNTDVVDQIIKRNLTSGDLNNLVRRTSCFYACVTDKSAVTSYGRINKQRLDEILLLYKTNNQTVKEQLPEIFYNCGQRDYNTSDRSEMNLQYLFCVITEKKLNKN